MKMGIGPHLLRAASLLLSSPVKRKVPKRKAKQRGVHMRAKGRTFPGVASDDDGNKLNTGPYVDSDFFNAAGAQISKLGKNEQNGIKKPDIIVVDDEVDILKITARSLESEGYNVEKATNGRVAMDKLKNKNFDLVITDLIMEGIDGIDILKYVKESKPAIPILIATASHDVKLAVKAINQGVDAYLIKPFDLNELFREVRRCLNKGKREKSVADNTACPYCEETRELIIMASHDLRSSLVSLGAAIKLLEKWLDNPADHNASQMVHELHKKVRATLHVAEDFLCRASFLHRTLGTEKEVVELKNEVILPTLSELSCELRDICGNGVRSLSVFSENSLYVKGQPVWLRAAFRNLLMNAIKHGSRGGQVVVSYKSINIECCKCI